MNVEVQAVRVPQLRVANAVRSAGKSGARAKGIVGGIMLGGIVVVTVFAPLLAPHNPNAIDFNLLSASPGAGHLFGTDELGRDMLSRVIYGGRLALLISAIAVLLGGTVALILGVASGFVGGWFDQVCGRLADVQLAFPAILLALILLSFGGSSLVNLVVVLSITGWPGFFRVARSQVLALRKRGFVEAATVLGASRARVVLRHLLPGILPFAAVLATLDFSRAVLFEAGLSYIGLGVHEPASDWGLMVASGQSQIGGAWWVVVFPGLALVITILGANLFGDWLADRLSIGGSVR